MAGGRPPKPTKLKILTGNPGKRKLNDREPKPAAGAPPCPRWLDVEAKRRWKYLMGVLQPLGLLTVADGATLEVLCQAWAEHRWATEALRKEGRTFTTATGYVIQHPAVGMQRSAWTAIKAYSALFGLDPSSRSKLQVPGGNAEEDAFEAFVKGSG